MSEPKAQINSKASEPSEPWFDNRSWLPSPTIVREPEQEPIPGSLDYLRLGCDDLYSDLGGES